MLCCIIDEQLHIGLSYDQPRYVGLFWEGMVFDADQW